MFTEPYLLDMTSRRDTVRALAGIAALPLVGKIGLYDLADIGRRAHALTDAGDKDSAPLRALTAAEFEAVTQAAEHIIPRTSTPGATDAKVANFIDVMMADWYDPKERDRFKYGLKELDTRATVLMGSPFTQLAPAKQVELLEMLDQEYQTLRREPAEHADERWFATLKYLTIWGYYTSRVGIEQELKQQLVAGHYDGNAPY
jgi:hypothetical protein